jgi:hypothetical protein
MKTFMTVKEWVDAYAKGLLDSLDNSFPDNMQGHIEDLAVWTATYSDNVYSFVSSLPRSYEAKKEEEYVDLEINTDEVQTEVINAVINQGAFRERERILELLEGLKGDCPLDCDDCESHSATVWSAIALIKEDEDA